MSSLNYYPPAKEEEGCWTEKEAHGLNIVVKEEEEEKEAFGMKEEDEKAITGKGEEERFGVNGVMYVSVKEENYVFGVKEEEEEALRVKEAVSVKEENDVFGVKEEVEEALRVKEEGEEETGDLINTKERPDSHSDIRKSPSGEPDPETPKPARPHHCSQGCPVGT
ncbi:uncharacterized protein LOC121570132 [Coregonus clupeaformis]|uniref:uncharacterized protein LOC121570132 n=1 Tax=Coregonus clupeaformis TaxID=59861 RepID=UPI001E1C2870|nr:uncharacterized protein LOC121570132 [Coregonus clupeaformis]